MLDFKELNVDGIEFELLVREILFTQGIDAYWSGVGADGGQDLMCLEQVSSPFGMTTRRWLVQCKHFAHSNRSVGLSDLDNIVDSARHHSADGYALFTTTNLSSKVVERLESIGRDKSSHLLTAYFDSALIERMLTTAKSFHIAQRFFPKSTANEQWRVNFTDRPNQFVVSFKGYIFHLVNRIGTSRDHHLTSIKSRIEDMEKIPFTKGHFLRPRAFWYDDKNGGYCVYIDYLFPRGERHQYSLPSLKSALGDGYALEDGQAYNFDIVARSYIPTSDHFDRDHYNYYVPYIGSFLVGEGRSRDPLSDWELHFDFEDDDDVPIVSNDAVVNASAQRAFERFASIVKDRFGDQVVDVRNAIPEAIQFFKNGNLAKAHELYGYNLERAFGAQILFKQSAKTKLFKFLEELDQTMDCSFHCREGWTFVPNDNERAERDFHDNFFFVTFTANFAESSEGIRQALNAYFGRMSDRLLGIKA